MRFSVVILFAACILSSLFWSCSKDPAFTHIDTLITGNNPPPYDGVSDDKIAAYINKLYIDLWGKAPSSDEVAAATNYLGENNLNDASRDALISGLMSADAYYDRLFAITSNEFIAGADSIYILNEIALFAFLYYVDSLGGNQTNLVYYVSEIIRLYGLQDVMSDFRNNLITLNQFYGVFLNNYLYDEVNMGSENFVKGSFDDLFRRAPTSAELTNGVSMVDNVSSILFLQPGDSKGDYINIVTTCDAFYEGLVRNIFGQLLLREPTSEEMAVYTSQLKSTGSLQDLEKTILKTDEYAGF